jgi:hypothetical protein
MRLSDEQLADYSRLVTSHRDFIERIDKVERVVFAYEVEHATLVAVGSALATLGHGPEVIGNVRLLLGAEETP